LPAILIIFPAVTAYPTEVTLTEDHPSPELDVTGYRLYYGYGSEDYPVSVDVGNQTTYTLSDLEEGETYFIAATAYDIYGNESDFSNEVVFDALWDGISDADDDGFEVPDDCDDTNPDVNPDQEEVCGNGIDDNCNGESEENCEGTIDPHMVPGDLDCDETFTGTDMLLQTSLVVGTIEWPDLPSYITGWDEVLERSDWDCSRAIDGTDALIGASIIVDLIAEGDTPLGQVCL
jgi:hypothetical protein